jgi:ubiquitin-conjugating enzyme E2 S
VGPTETPFESGVFHISLRIPSTYPQEPPKANFATRIFHPNVDDKTGDVCVDTLKRDWNPKLTLHDVLVTIRCLLVYPNPTSSLNEAAGKLLLEDYDEFARHARLMTEVHAAVPEELKNFVEETRNRKAVDDDADDNVKQKPSRLVDSSTGTNTPTKSTPSSKHKRQASKTSSTPVARKIKRDTSPTVKAAAETVSGSDSDDSGKENADTRLCPVSPAGVKRSREESAVPAEENEKGDAEKDTSEASRRKSPKLKDETKTSSASKNVQSSAKPKVKKITTSSGTPAQKKSVPKMGLKRF